MLQPTKLEKRLQRVAGLGATMRISGACYATESAYIIHVGRLIDGISKTSIESVSILVINNKITSITPGYVDATEDRELLNLKDHTLMPGLMDMHVHIMGEAPDTPSPDYYTEPFRKNDVDFAFGSDSIGDHQRCQTTAYR